jgi:hypothetical protein
LDSFLASFESEKKNDLTKYLINFFNVNTKKALLANAKKGFVIILGMSFYHIDVLYTV